MAKNLQRMSEAADDDPGNALLRMEFALALVEGGQYAEGLRNLYRAAALGPELAEPQYNLGVLYGGILLNDLAVDEAWEDHTDEEILFENAALHYRNAIQLDPSMVRALNNLARLCALRGLTEEACDLLRRSLDIDPNQSDVEADLEEIESTHMLIF